VIGIRKQYAYMYGDNVGNGGNR